MGCTAELPAPPATRPAATAAATLSPDPTATVPSVASPTPSPVKLADLVDAGAMREHLEAFQSHVGYPEVSRATGTTAFGRSVAYVDERLRAAGYHVERQDFPVGSAGSTNLIAELRGRTDRVIILGAHLDSVTSGPGINDNASGVAALLEIASELSEVPPLDLTVRFAFWGAEEGGPFGSQAYVDALSPEQRDRIVAYLNFDMLASPNAVTFVYDEAGAAPGSEALTDAFAAYFDGAGVPWDPVDLEGDSDHGPFIAAGIPTGGLFSGGIEVVTDGQAERFGAIAGHPADPCSHQACDTIDNVDLATLEFMADAVADVLVTLASVGP